jgi:hypothetical protein
MAFPLAAAAAPSPIGWGTPTATVTTSAFVYHSRSAYVISIITYGGTYPQIVDLARTIHDFFSR